MTDASYDPSSDGELLSAYLTGELDDVTARQLQRRLADEPELVRQLDALAGALVTMGGVDTVAEPDGFADRLAQRLDEERRRQAPARRTGLPGWLAGGGAVAAVLVAVAVVSSTMLGGGGDSADVATDDSAGRAATEFADLGVAESADESAPAQDSVEAGAGSARPPGPIIVDSEPVEVASQGALRRRYRNLPEVEALLGVSVDEAAELADEHTQRLQEYDADGDLSPQACLDVVSTEASAPIVVVRVERVIYDGQPAVAYVVVTASPDATVLDRVEVWVVAPPGCATLIFLQL